MNQCGRGRFQGFSAGSHPKGQVHPIALHLLERMKFPTEGLRRKSWDEFAVPGAARSTSCSPYVTTPRAKSALTGRGNR